MTASTRDTPDFQDEYYDESGDRRVWISETADEDAAYQHGLPKGWFSFRRLWLFMGPGFLMSIAYLGFLIQTLAAKLGVATGLHLSQQCRKHYPRPARLALWAMTEIAIIGSDIQEVIGSAIAILLLTNGRVPIWAGVLITAADSFAILLVERLGVRLLEAVFGGLIGVMAISFGCMYFWAEVPTGTVLEGMVVPRLPRKDMTWATAIVGAIIMPHNIYLHSALVQSRGFITSNVLVLAYKLLRLSDRRINTSYIGRKKEAVIYFYIESALALVVSLIINIFVLSVFAKGFYGKEEGDIGLENAGQFLGKTFGSHMKYIWAVGLLAAGQSSTMTGTYTGQFVMNGFLDIRMSLWLRITVTRLIAILPTLLVALTYRSSKGTELDVLNEWLNVLNSVQLPFALVPVLTMTASSQIMGAAFTNSMSITVLAWAVALLIMAINLSAIYDFAVEHLPRSTLVLLIFLFIVLFYLGFIFYLGLGPQRIQRLQARFGEKKGESTENGVSQPLLETEDSQQMREDASSPDSR